MTSSQDINRERKIISLCDAALALESNEREQYLANACEDDLDLYNSVLDLMGAVDESKSFLLDEDGESGLPQVGDSIGPYQLISELGSGGMGTVFRAERATTGFGQHVALKLVNAQLLTPELP